MQYGPVNGFSPPYEFLNNSFFSIADIIIRIRYITHIIHKICVNWLFMLLVRLLANRRLLSFGVVKSYISIFDCVGEPCP